MMENTENTIATRRGMLTTKLPLLDHGDEVCDWALIDETLNEGKTWERILMPLRASPTRMVLETGIVTLAFDEGNLAVMIEGLRNGRSGAIIGRSQYASIRPNVSVRFCEHFHHAIGLTPSESKQALWKHLVNFVR
jgi:hypothetical protein